MTEVNIFGEPFFLNYQVAFSLFFATQMVITKVEIIYIICLQILKINIKALSFISEVHISA